MSVFQFLNCLRKFTGDVAHFDQQVTHETFGPESPAEHFSHNKSEQRFGLNLESNSDLSWLGSVW